MGIGGSAGVYVGPARIVRNFDDLMELADGEVLVTSATGESFNSFLHVVGAIVTDHGSFASHAAIMGREMGFPAVVGTVDGTQPHPERLARARGRQGRHGRDRRLPRRRLGRSAQPSRCATRRRGTRGPMSGACRCATCSRRDAWGQRPIRART